MGDPALYPHLTIICISIFGDFHHLLLVGVALDFST